MRQCAKCKEYFAEDAFSWKSQVRALLSSYCKSCNKYYQQAHYLANKEIYAAKRRVHSSKVRKENHLKLLKYLQNHPCVDCGEIDPVVLEFDHQKPGDKVKEIGNMLSGAAAWTSIWSEIQKCEVRCANCHKRKTARDFKWYKAPSSIG